MPRTKRSPPSRAPDGLAPLKTQSQRAAGPTPDRRTQGPTLWRVLKRLLIVGALAVLSGALLIRLRQPPRALALPDPPTPQERALLARVASARRDDSAPARLLGDYYADSARPFLALWAYAAALQAQPADDLASLGMARTLDRALFCDAAIAKLQQVLARRPGQPEAATQLAELYLQTGRPDAALAVVRAAGSALAGSRGGAVLEGRVRQALGDALGAKAAYWRAVAQDANDADVRHRIGLLALSQRDGFAAQQSLGAARVLAPANLRYAVDLGRAFAASSRREEQRRAPEFYSAALAQDPHYGPAHYETGVWYLRQSRWREAIEGLQMAVDADPGDADAHEQLAHALEAAGRGAEAHRQRGLARDAQELPVAALREYLAWAALDRDNPEAEIQIAQSYFNIDRTKEAQARLEQARRRFTRDAAVRERLIAFYILGLDQEQARRLCQEWLREEPGSSQALWLLGRTAEASQQYAEAVRLYERALAKEPGNLAWVGTLGMTLLTLSETAARPEDARRAAAALARAATGDPAEPRWRVGLGRGLQRLGRSEEARRQALGALDLGPRESQAYNLVVQCARQERAVGPLTLFASLLREVGAQQREEQSLRRATWERPRDPETYAALAEFLLRIGDPGAAESQWSEAARLRPDWPKVRARLAMVRRLRQVL